MNNEELNTKGMVLYIFNHKGNTYVGSTKDFKDRCRSHNMHMRQKRHNKCRFYQYCIQNNIWDIRKHTQILSIFDGDYNKEFLREQEQIMMQFIQPNLNTIRAKKNMIII